MAPVISSNLGKVIISSFSLGLTIFVSYTIIINFPFGDTMHWGQESRHIGN